MLHFYKVDFLFFVAFLSYDILFLHVYRWNRTSQVALHHHTKITVTLTIAILMLGSPPPTSHYVRLCWNVKMGCSVVFFVVVFFTVDNILHLQNQCAITPCDPYGVRNGLYGATKIITQDAGVCVWPAVHLFKKKKGVLRCVFKFVAQILGDLFFFCKESSYWKI